METKKVFKWVVCILLVIALGGGIGAVSYIMVSVKKFDQVYANNVSIEGVDIGGISREEAKVKLEPKLKEYLATQNIMLVKGDKKASLYLKDLPVKYEIEAALDEAYKVGHNLSFLEKYKVATGKKVLEPVDLDVRYVFNENTVEAWVSTVEPQFEVKAVDATIERKNRNFIITPEKNGEAMDVKQTAEKVIQVLKDNQLAKEVEIVTKTLIPVHTTEMLKEVQTPIASFQTSYNNADPFRNENLKVAARKINKVLAPGGVFSLGEQLEPITYEEGYRSSKVIVNGQLEDGIGGGVCQIASTLYNAVLLSNLDITMRQNHSLPVAYVPLGRDATYATGVIDFKFQNTSEYPVFIESYCEDNQVIVNIFSHKSLKPTYDEVKFYSETIEEIPAPPTKYEEDPTLQKGTKVQKVTPLDGKKVKLYKMCYNDGKLVHKEWINQSYYKPRAAVVKVGTKEAKQTQVQKEKEMEKEKEKEAFMEMEPTIELEKQLGDD